MRTRLNISNQKAHYAQDLFENIIQLAQRDTNIILQILDPYKSVNYEQQYPDKPVILPELSLCAYYHAHENIKIDPNEHGHCHFFLQADMETKRPIQHLVALSFDSYGQPLSWFTVNHWVTAGASYDPELFRQSIAHGERSEQGTIVQHCLSNMILFYQDDIAQLLIDSKKTLQTQQARHKDTVTNIQENRELYFLSKKDISLSDDLVDFLAPS